MSRAASTGARNTWLLALFILVGTGGAMYWLKGDGAQDAQTSRPEAAPQEEVIDVTPLVPHGRIVSASWNGAGTARAGSEDSARSVLDQVDWSTFGEDAERKTRFKESLEETVKDVDGLGVYVAPEIKDEDDKK